MYLAKKENFNANNITGLMGMLRQYTTYHGNKFGPKMRQVLNIHGRILLVHV